MKLEGEIGEINVIEHLVGMGRERFTGAVRFENDGIIKIIYFKTGDVLSASTNDRADSVDEILLRAGKVTREHIKQALAKRKENETLGDALLNLGFITRKELTWARRAQAIGVIRSIDAWTAGQFTVVADYLPKREEGTIFPLPQIIIELTVTDQDRQKYERELSGGEAVFAKLPGFEDSFRSLGLNEDAEAIALQIDGKRSAAEIASASGKDTFNVYKLLHALSVLSLLQREDKPKVLPEISFETQDDLGLTSAGVADAADMWGESAALPTDVPALSIGIGGPSIPAPEKEIPHLSVAASPSTLSWDEPAPAAVSPSSTFTPLTGTPGPAAAPPPQKWDMPPYASPVLQPPKPAGPEQWGFDEAQLETSRRATTPSQLAGERIPPSIRAAAQKKSKPNRWLGMVIAAAAVILIAFGGFAGWNWWQSRSEGTSQVQAKPPARRPNRSAQPAQTSTASATTADTTASAATASAPSTTTGAAATASAATTTTSTSRTTTATPATPVRSAATLPTTQTTPPSAVPAKRDVKPVPTTPPPMAPATVAAAPASGTRVQRGPTGTTITNATEGAPTNATRTQFDEMARKFAGQANGNYTVQFELVCEASSLTTAVKLGGANIWFIPFEYRNRQCYRVFWGRYATQAEATAAVAQIPAALRGAKPVVVSVPKP